MRSPRRPPDPLDVYLQPAVVGGGLGDIEEVLLVGRRLERLGWKPRIYRRDGRSLPPSVEGPWGWPTVQRVRRISPQARHALTITPWWGVSARPDLGRSEPPGPWSTETGDLERAYRADRVVHLSLEEFARTLTSPQQTRERWREGGVATREIPARLQAGSGPSEVSAFHDAYRKWRAFDRPNVLHLFTGFARSAAFGREFPEAVQVGPLWPETPRRRIRRPVPAPWVWYASPSSSDRLAKALAEALSRPGPSGAPVEIRVRAPRRFDLPPAAGVRWRRLPPLPPRRWSETFCFAGLRIATGSRTLIEALAVRGPFLYFNGVLNQGTRTRVHRPEKLRALLAAWRGHGVPVALRHDLADFARLRGVAAIVRRARDQRSWATRFPHRADSIGFPPAWADAGRLIDRWAAEWAGSDEPASATVARWRAAARAARSRL